MRAKKETIKLDAVIVDVIIPSVFVSELSNGHRLVAVESGWRRPGEGRVPGLRIGDRVMVAVCPGDMANGRIVRS